MKKSVLVCICFSLLLINAKATVYTFTPPGASNLGNLDHTQWYAWGINWAVPQGQEIVSATLSFSNIWNWRIEPNVLFIHLFDTAPLGVYTGTDNEGGGDYFANNNFGINHIRIAAWSDPAGGNPANAHNLSFAFDANQLNALRNYLGNGGPAAGWGSFGFGLDPDCHYFNNGVSFRIVTRALNVPEGGSSILLLGIAAGGLALARRKLSR